ncbi:hypothetical protein WJX81_001824 [Elliptochloris bilobata]|uniref:Uncharacterized protein n=1 Tax=Elliptochloris bilobata TaxID=381761 RepID=A0AAW1QZ96_9CHLO
MSTLQRSTVTAPFGNILRSRAALTPLPLVLALRAQRKCLTKRQVAARAATSEPEGTIVKEAGTIRQISWISFWSQLALAVVSSVVIFFTVTTSTPQGGVVSPAIVFSIFGVVTSFISTFLAYSLTRTARKVLEGGQTVSKASVAGSLLAAVRLNLWGLGATLLGLQASVGTLVGKTLLTSTSNPYAAGSGGARLQSTPAALDVFGIQASTNTLLAHFVSIVFANWLQNLLLKRTAPAAAKRGGFFNFGGGSGSFGGGGPGKAVEPDYTARGRKGPTGAAY